jgi:hypothetical protein
VHSDDRAAVPDGTAASVTPGVSAVGSALATLLFIGTLSFLFAEQHQR